MQQDLTTPDYWDEHHLAKPSAAGGLRAWVRHRLREEYSDLLQQLLDAPGKDGASVLEIGCAPGTMIELMHRLRPGFRYSGIDYASEALEETRQRLAYRRIDAELFEGDVREFRPPKPFDLVVSFGLVEHFDDPVPMVECHARCAAPGGMVAITVPNYATPRAQRVLLERLAPQAFRTHNLAIMDPAALGRVLEDAGLKGVRSGSGTGAQFYTGGQASDPAARAYLLAARVWNMAAACLPPVRNLWGCRIWATGRLP
jgi:2-polyprenyl-3-methyl-5-hydroxy-6-metoxy-1,4-benzoquinol methylase